MSLPALQETGDFRSLEEKVKFGELVVSSGLALGHKSAASVVVALQFGMELGLKPMQALRLTTVINGRPSLSADGCVAIALSHPDCVYFRAVEETAERATWETMRKGLPEPKRFTFTMEEAKRAKLATSQVWTSYPQRMLAARAKKYLAQDVYPDILGGVLCTEELEDMGGATPTPTTFEPLQPRRLSERPEAPPPDPVAAEVVDPDEERIGAEVFGTYGEGRDPTDLLGDEEKHALKEYVLEHGLTDKQLAAYCRQLGVKKGALTVAQAKLIRQWAGAQ